MTRLQAHLMLILAAACWGLENIPQKTVLAHLDPFTAVGLRGLIGALLIAMPGRIVIFASLCQDAGHAAQDSHMSGTGAPLALPNLIPDPVPTLSCLFAPLCKKEAANGRLTVKIHAGARPIARRSSPP